MVSHGAEYNNSLNYTSSENQRYAGLYENYLEMEMVFVVFGIIALILCIALMVITLSYKEMCESVNKYLTKWTITNVIIAFTAVACFETFCACFETDENDLYFYYELEFVTIMDLSFFVFLLGVDWCIVQYLPKYLEKFRKRNRGILVPLWKFVFVYLVTSDFMNIFAHELRSVTICIFTFLLILVAVLYVVRVVKSFRMFLLLIPTAFVICLILCWMNFLLLYTIQYPPFLGLCTIIAITLHSTLNYTLMIVFDKEFKMGQLKLLSLLSCGLYKVPSEQTYQNNSNHI